jgi:hypothetical protein
MLKEAADSGKDAIASPITSSSRDILLLGVAGMAVAAAVGIAIQKRVASEDD